MIEISPPPSLITNEEVFANNDLANLAVISLYANLNNVLSQDMTRYGGASADEYGAYFSTSADIGFFATNTIPVNNTRLRAIWGIGSYAIIYTANAIIERLVASQEVTASMKDQFTGEAKFVRAFSYFYLVNMFGDVPLVTVTDVRQTATMSRTPKQGVYRQIIADLQDAQRLLPAGYTFSNNERIRANKGVATALLARVYLYLQDWINAEAQATQVMTSGDYNLQSDRNSVFLKNSNEAILQGWNRYGVTNDAGHFIPGTSSAPNWPLSASLLNAFEPGDARRNDWTGAIIYGGQTYYYPFKYKETDLFAVVNPEYQMFLRIAEQYLIRAEARAQQANISGAREDLNSIRNRAGLANTTANDKAALLSAIEHERRIELFSEWGHRWFDLKRTNRADAVLAPLKPAWKPTAVWYPIPLRELEANPNLTQNPGY